MVALITGSAAFASGAGIYRSLLIIACGLSLGVYLAVILGSL